MHSLALYLLYCRFDIGFLEVFKVEKQIRSAFDDEDNIIFDLTTTSNNHYRRVPRRKWTGSRSAFVYILHNIVKGITGRWFHVIILVFNDARNRRKNLRPLSGSFHWHQIHSVKNAWIQLEIGARDFFVPAPLALYLALGASSSLTSNQTFLTFFFLNKWVMKLKKLVTEVDLQVYAMVDSVHHKYNCWFLLDVTKIQTTKLSMLTRF